MTKQQRQHRRDKRELAAHHRAMNLRHETKKLARAIRTPDELFSVLSTFTGDEWMQAYTALRPHLSFVVPGDPYFQNDAQEPAGLIGTGSGGPGAAGMDSGEQADIDTPAAADCDGGVDHAGDAAAAEEQSGVYAAD